MQNLEKKSKEIRLKIFKTIIKAGKGHVGGAFSCVDLIVGLYYGKHFKFNPNNPKCESRDRFFFSKGHAGLALYVLLADLGYFDEKELLKYNEGGGKIAEHPDTRLPGIEAVSGSLGHGLGLGCGLALSSKLNNYENNFFTYVLLGDGECNEGLIWESALFASHHKLSNLVTIVDRNKLSVLDYTENIINLEPFADKWKSFGWEVIEIDGHNNLEIDNTFRYSKERKSEKPLLIIANTIKGKGVSYMENKVNWHHGVPNKEQIEIALNELE